MRVLFLAPLPPPVTGHSVVSETLLRGLRAGHEVDVVDLGVDSRHDGTVTASRIAATLKLLRETLRFRPRFDRAYLTISESLAGNVKDLLIYAICSGKLDRLVIHLHGGSIGRLLFDRYPVVRRINRWFIRRLRAVIVSGSSHHGIFDGMVDPRRLHTIPNFAPDALFLPAADVAAKFAAIEPLRILYVSGMTEAKGCTRLLEAWLSLPAASRHALRLDFAGRFDDEAAQQAFAQRIDGVPGVAYHGVVDDETKRRLFADAHVFCLPSAHLEGQPISILEAYASGCVVSSTVPPGVRDVFEPGVNGFAIERADPAAIAAGLESLVADRGRLASIALANRAVAQERYRVRDFVEAVNSVIVDG